MTDRDRHDELAAMSDEELFEELDRNGWTDDLRHDVGIRLGVQLPRPEAADEGDGQLPAMCCSSIT